jgi:hypothetical protein
MVYFVSFLSIIGIVFGSLSLRPVADDFCFAQATKLGVWHAMSNWYFTWVGDLTVTFFNTIFVGLPGSISPKLLFIPFIVSNALIAVVVVELLFASETIKFRFLQIFLAFPAWCAYLWFPAFSHRLVSSSTGLPNQIADQTTFWQVVNSSYTMPTCLVVLLFVKFGNVFLRKNNVNSFLRIIGITFIGLFIGFSGYVIAIAVLIWETLSIHLPHASFKKFKLAGNNLERFLFSVALGIGFLISYASPGATIRKGNLPNLNVYEILSQLPMALITSFFSILQLVTSVSTLVAILAGFTLQRIAPKQSIGLNVALILNLSGFFIVLSFVNRISELFSYKAVSHLQSSIVLLFFISLSFGALLSNTLEGKFKAVLWNWTPSIAVFLWIVVLAFSIVYMGVEGHAFLQAWHVRSGFNSLPGFNSGWISDCANGIF